MAPEMAAEDPAMAAGAPQGGAEDQMMQQVAQMAQEIIQQMGPDVAAMLAQAIMEMLQGGAAGPAEGAPQGEPVFKTGGTLSRRVKKGCGGIKAANGIKVEAKKGDVHKDKNRHDNRF